jgi:transposase
MSRREDLVAHLVAEQTRRTQCDPTSRLWPHLVEAIALGEQHLATIAAEIDAVVASAPQLAARRTLVRTVPGIGRIISLVLLAYLPELGDRDRRHIAALAGLAPVANDSGTSTGTRVGVGGRAPVRTAMSHAALPCVTHGCVPPTVSRDQYREMASRTGAKRALIAIARRMLVVITAMVRDTLTWEDTAIRQGHHPRPPTLPRLAA